MRDVIFPNDVLENCTFQYPVAFWKPAEPEAIIMRDETHMAFGQAISFAHGDFDDYCAWTRMYLPNGDVLFGMPRDTYYFEIASRLGERYGNRNIYDTVRNMYEDVLIRPEGSTLASPVIPRVLRNIRETADAFGIDSPWVMNMLMHLYYGMVAEENKARSYLGKSIKLLGLYEILIAKRDIYESANFMRNTPRTVLKQQCEERGILYDMHENRLLQANYETPMEVPDEIK